MSNCSPVVASGMGFADILLQRTNGGSPSRSTSQSTTDLYQGYISFSLLPLTLKQSILDMVVILQRFGKIADINNGIKMCFVSWFQSIVIRFHCFEDFGEAGNKWKKDTGLMEARK